MAVVHTYTCICGTEESATKGWILAEVRSDAIAFLPWNHDTASRDDIITLCGERCATTLLSRSMGEWESLPTEIPQEMPASLTASVLVHSHAHSYTHDHED